MLLIDKINENLLEFNFKLSIESAVYNKDSQTLCLVFKYADNLMLSNSIKKIVEQTLIDFYNKDLKYTIKYKKNFYDETILVNFLKSKLKIDYPMLTCSNKTIKLNSENKSLEMCLDEKYRSLVETKLDVFLQQLLKEEYDEDFKIYLKYEKAEPTNESQTDNNCFDTQTFDNFEIKIDSIEEYIGELITSPIFPIASFMNCEDGVTICGKIEDLVENKTKPKIDEQGKKKPEKTFYTFNIKDYSGMVRCVYFPTKANLPKFQKLANDSEIVMFGDLEEDSYSTGLVFKPRVINLCILPKEFYSQIYSKPVPKSYTKIFPEPYNFVVQDDLFSKSDEITNEYLLNNDFVVFDLETTGTNYQHDKIIEIGAVKVEKGKLTETFSCLVNPECHIPEDATKVNNIYDSDVKDALKISEVMPDFFKFCDKCIMVSYVIDFDFNFIDFNGSALGYKFTNKTDDAFVMAKQNVKGVKNYKLTTIAKALNVELVNAHRAVYDAIAAAEVMIKILNKK